VAADFFLRLIHRTRNLLTNPCDVSITCLEMISAGQDDDLFLTISEIILDPVRNVSCRRDLAPHSNTSLIIKKVLLKNYLFHSRVA
jgi:hypothetical protein